MREPGGLRQPRTGVEEELLGIGTGLPRRRAGWPGSRGTTRPWA